MDTVPSVVAALDAHREIADVAGAGLWFLHALTLTPGSMVSS
jgi:hypothetical protein